MQGKLCCGLQEAAQTAPWRSHGGTKYTESVYNVVEGDGCTLAAPSIGTTCADTGEG